MMKWPDTNDASILQYIRNTRLRPASIKTYQPMLEEFRQFVIDHSPELCVSRQILEGWLRHRSSFPQYPRSCTGFGQSIVSSTGSPTAD
jgi:hypothetical protein